MAPLRIGSLFTGTGALDLAVMDVFDAEVVWHSQYEPPDRNGKEDTNQYAAKILERHWPGVPNLWDITKVDWQAVLAEHGPVDILTGGFPCQDVSSAGKRAGLTADSRSGLWAHFARAIHELNPRLVVIENVEGLLSADADRGLGLDAEDLEEEAGAGRVLRALGAVLGDLATLGFHAEWERVGADEVGAPHRRRRIIIYAWPAAFDAGGFGRWYRPGFLGGLGVAGRDAEVVADPANLGHERGGDARRRGHGPADGSVSTAHTCGQGLEVGRVQPDRDELPAAERGRREPAADTPGHAGRIGDGDDVRAGSGTDGREPATGRGAAPDTNCVEPERRGVAGVLGGQAAAEPREEDQSEEGQPEREPGLDPVGRGVRRATPADTDRVGWRADVLDLRPGQPDLDWGDYEPAIRRWEAVLGRRAPWPTDSLGRLSAVFTEWMMGLPDGWVTGTPGLTRSAMLRALGNGVVRLQAAAALVVLHQRAVADDQAADGASAA